MTTVFSYLVDPQKFVQWMGVEAQIDPRPGGEFRLDVDGEHIAIGRYEVVDPPHRLVFSWGWEGNRGLPPGSTKVEITLDPDGQGTLLRLRHSDLPSEAERVTHRDGWKIYMRGLATLLA